MNSDQFNLKEIVSATLALSIVAFSIWLMHASFSASPSASPDHFQRMSGIVNAAIGFAGTVLGYYFGRIPAEKSAEAAQLSASEAQRNLSGATQSASTNAALADRLSAKNTNAAQQLAELRSQMPITPLGGAGDHSAETVSIPDRLDQILRTLS